VKNSTIKPLITISIPCMSIQGGTTSPAAEAHMRMSQSKTIDNLTEKF